MLKRYLTDTWTVFITLVFGLLLLMISARPGLQPRRGHEDAAGPTIALIGHALSWSAASVLTYRMVRGSRELSRTQKPGPGA